ncbi:MAG: GtrA family protein [Gammaproteobacteria bacterium]
MPIALTYSFFAIIAIAANILSQELALLLYAGPYELVVAIFVGTGTGLVLKFLLDRKYIFKANTKPLSKDGLQFLAYTATGVLTTFLFWGTEIAFDFYFANKSARYIGAVLGLSCGYYLKYQLDKRFVFTGATPS